MGMVPQNFKTMATIKFILSKSQHQKKTKSNESMLMLRYTHKKRVTLFTTHKNINDKYWDDKNQMIKKGCPGSERLNAYIRTIRQKLEDIVNELLIKGEDPTTSYVKELYTQTKEKSQLKTKYTFFEYAEQFIENSKKIKNPSTIKVYRTVVNRLKDYSKYSNRTINWHSIDMEFYYDFFEYYTEVEGFLNNGFGRIIKVLKVILNEATEKGYNTNLAYKNKGFKTVKEEVNNIYLNEGELQKMMDVDLSKRKTLEQVRDLFIVGCYTGLRFSDFSSIKREYIDFERNILKVKTIKTDQSVTIPLVDVVKKILNKYKHTENSLPKSFQNQTMNKKLKEIGRLAKINNTIVKIRNKGRERKEETFKKYQLISTHTARRSFATNMVKRGVPPIMVMKITGHKTEKAFLSYIKITEDENAQLMMKYLKKAS